MIPILYKADETEFKTYGIGALSDIISCSVTEERNSTYECVFTYPITGAFYSEIQNERIIKAKPNDTSADQAFRIYRITKPLNGIVKVYAQHISYDLNGIAAALWEGGTYTPQLAIEHVFNNALTEHNFTFTTDYIVPKEFSVSKPKSVRAVLGGEEGSLISLWGGEFEWDNFNVIHHQGRGSNNGVVIEYGKNLTKLEHDLDISEVYTHLLPYATYTDEDGNETLVTLTEQLLTISDTTLVQPKTLIKDFSEYFEYGVEITEDELRETAQNYIDNNSLGSESPSITISFEALWKQPEYAAVLERVSLCDTVTIRHTDLGVSVKSKVTKTVYDTLAEKYTSITLGSSKSSLITTLSETQSSTEKASTKTDNLSAIMTTAINNSSKLITGQTGGYVVLHGDDTGQPYELLILDTPNIEDAVNVWRWNSGGLGFSSNGYNGPFTTAITSDGEIVADFVATGTLVANLIKAGTLSSANGNSYWNFETGEVKIDGTVYATAGEIGGFGISSKGITIGKTSYSDSVSGVYIGTDGIGLGAGAFYVTSSGKLYSNNAEISGKITATSGEIGGLVLTSDSISSSDGSFKATSDGKLYASNAEISGVVYATSGTIGGLTLNENGISSSNGNFSVTSEGVLTAKNLTVSLDATVETNFIRNTLLNKSGLKVTTGYADGDNTQERTTRIDGGYVYIKHYIDGNGDGTENYDRQQELYIGDIADSYGDLSYAWGILSTCDRFYLRFAHPGYGDSDNGLISIYPESDGTCSIYLDFTTGKLYGSWYLGSSTAVTSDENLKNSIESLPGTYETLFDSLTPVRFKYNDGTSGRYHTGFTTGDVKKAIDAAALSTNDFAAYIEEKDKDGNTTCYLRYEEFIALCVDEIQKLKKRVQALEEGK